MAAPNIVTTGHNAEGLSVFIDNPEYKIVSPQVGIVYSSDGAPINLNDNSDITAFAAREHPGVFPKQGSVVVVAEWPPSTNSKEHIHRTLSVDIGVILSGQIECHLDSGEKRLVKQGDVILQRGTKHYWVNPSATETAKMLCFIMPSEPVKGAKD